MKVRRLFISAICLPLIATSGCGPKHAPVSVTVLVPSQDGAPALIEPSSVLAEKGATLTFTMADGSPSDTTLEVQFLKNGVAKKVCRQGTTTTLTGPSPLSCTLKLTGDFDIVILETSGKRHLSRRGVKAYIRPCTGCTT